MSEFLPAPEFHCLSHMATLLSLFLSAAHIKCPKALSTCYQAYQWNLGGGGGGEFLPFIYGNLKFHLKDLIRKETVMFPWLNVMTFQYDSTALSGRVFPPL